MPLIVDIQSGDPRRAIFVRVLDLSRVGGSLMPQVVSTVLRRVWRWIAAKINLMHECNRVILGVGLMKSPEVSGRNSVAKEVMVE